MSKKLNVNDNAKLPTNAQVEKFTMLSPMLDSVLEEMKEFSKKKQDGVLNPLKVKMINRILEQIKAILSNEPTVEFLDLLDDETLPTNSDVVLILSQYRTVMNQFEDKYHIYEEKEYEDELLKGTGATYSTRRWVTQENP